MKFGHCTHKRFVFGVCSKCSLPSRKNLKCLIARYSPNNSRSKVLYFFSGGRSRLLKKARGCHTPCTYCSSTAPSACSEASEVREICASGAGWLSMAASDKAAFIDVKALSISAVQLRTCRDVDFCSAQ